MSKSSEQIYMDYAEMRMKAEKLEELAEQVRNLANTQVGCYGKRTNFWEGDSGDMYRQKLTKLEHNMIKRAKELDKTAHALRKAAEKQYRLEKELAALVSGAW